MVDVGPIGASFEAARGRALLLGATNGIGQT